MKIKSEEIDRIVDLVLANLKNKKLVSFKAPEEKVRQRMIEIFMQNLEQEDRLDGEVEEILKKFEREISSGQIDYRKMFQKIKNQLAKERNFIL